MDKTGLRSLIDVRCGVLPRLAALACCGAFLLFAGCSQFFPPLNSGGGGGGGGGTSSGDYLYAGNVAVGNYGIAAFSFANSTLNSLSSSPVGLSFPPVALAVSRNNNYLFVGGGSSLSLETYPINSNGTLGTAFSYLNYSPAALKIDTTGGYLIAVDALAGTAYAFQIATSSGALSPLSSSLISLAGCVPGTNVPLGLSPSLAITPDDKYVYASCGTAGIYVLGFNSSNGQLTNIGQLAGPTNGGADLGLAVATTTSGSSTSYYLLAAETVTNGVRVFSINSSSGNITQAGSAVSTGQGPAAILVDSAKDYVYVANRIGHSISGFTLGSGGTLTAVSNSPFGTGLLPMALVEDNSHTYLAAICSGGNADLETYTIDTGGELSSLKNSATGADPTQASSGAATH